MNREIVFRTDRDPRKQETPPRRSSYSPKNTQRKDKHQESSNVLGKGTPRRLTFYSPCRQHRSPTKASNEQDRAAIDQWEKRYEDQEARHNYGPMKTLTYAAATTSGYRRNEQPRTRRTLERR